MSKNCYICGKEIGLLSFRLSFTDGSVVCADCAKKAGIVSQKDIEGATLKDVKEWVEEPSKRQEYISQKKKAEEQKRTEELERQKKLKEEMDAQQREEERIKKENAERAYRLRLEEEEREREETLQWEREHFPEGRIHTSVFSINYNNWSELDDYVQKIQDKGNIIVDVHGTGIVYGNSTTSVIVMYRKPLI